jgi:hypothetical protein
MPCLNYFRPIPWLPRELFHSIMLGAQAKSIDALLPLIVSGLTDRVDFALARIWLLETPLTGADREKRGSSRALPTGPIFSFERFSFGNTAFAIPFATVSKCRLFTGGWPPLEWHRRRFFRDSNRVLKIGHIAQGGESLHFDEQEIANSQWTAYPNWVARDPE